MTSLGMFAEPFPPYGGIDAHSARRTLGTFSMDFWQLFLRETLQNSWDARADASEGVTFAVDAWRLTDGQYDSLRCDLLRDRPVGSELGTLLRREPIDVLTVTDTGTRGLGGPTRADQVSSGRRDFVDLVRNIGRDPAKGYDGGTYGYGKAVLFEASSCATVVIFTRTQVEDRPVSRLIAMALTRPYDFEGRTFTGRHWWGVPDPESGAEPLTGEPAERLALALGMNRLQAGATGTTIMILAPRIDEDDSLRQVIDALGQAAADYAWPHLTAPTGGRPRLTVEVTCNGQAVPAPDPATDQRLKHFVEAYRRCETVLRGTAATPTSYPWNVQEVLGSRPVQRLGVLAWRTHLPGAAGAHERADAQIALMRGPRMVVDYRDVTADASGQAITGVFIADPELNDDFAAAEPPTHDRWQPRLAQRQRFARNPVSQALNHIDRIFKDRRGADRAEMVDAENGPGITRLASLLGSLLDTQPGGTDPRIPAPRAGGRADVSPVDASDHRSPNGSRTTPEERRSGPGPDVGRGQDERGRSVPAPRRGSVTVRFHPQAQPALMPNGVPCADFAVDLDTRSAGDGVVLVADPLIAVADGRPEKADDGVRVTVIGWRSRDTGEFQPGSRLTVTPATPTAWSIRVTQPNDAAVTVTVRTEVGAA
ncbi:hypothetical protein GCM10010169_16480 [Micromonospora fulviviridis]|uniref:hypothetical protein n=1 Tax=Micromonospora fulviviridis TaxID=47860 RepID=UPI0016644A8B|nr:hypothetical protein [Micromonospora fulviviridis]GGR73189.1 hypothetical protein GCM10010169_16480 [Micromonospora fulviviridis]